MPGEHITELQALLGDKGLLTAPGDLVAYETGARYDRGRAAFVTRPMTTDEASAVMACCIRHGITLIPQSGNTGVVAGSTPDDSGAQGVLSLDRMRETFDLDTANRTLRVSAGFRLSEVDERLAPHGLFFPIDLGADPCIGGMVATNTGGARFLRYGDVRRNTLGVTVVLPDADGSVLEAGRALRKDNTGVDWKQAFIGTSGAFGVITECILNVERLPRQTATAYLVPRADEDVLPLLDTLERQLGLYLSAFESMSGAAIRHTFAHAPSLRNPFPGGQVPDLVILVELTRSWDVRVGELPLDETLTSVLGDIWEAPEPLLQDAFVGAPDQMWALRHALSEGVKSAGDLVAFDLSFRRGDIMRFRSHMRETLATKFPDCEICDFGHVGDGGTHFNLVLPKGGAADTQRVAALRDHVVLTAVEMFDGSFSAEHGLGRRNQSYYDKYTPQKLRDLSAAFARHIAPSKLGNIRLG